MNECLTTSQLKKLIMSQTNGNLKANMYISKLKMHKVIEEEEEKKEEEQEKITRKKKKKKKEDKHVLYKEVLNNFSRAINV